MPSATSDRATREEKSSSRYEGPTTAQIADPRTSPSGIDQPASRQTGVPTTSPSQRQLESQVAPDDVPDQVVDQPERVHREEVVPTKHVQLSKIYGKHVARHEYPGH